MGKNKITNRIRRRGPQTQAETKRLQEIREKFSGSFRLATRHGFDRSPKALRPGCVLLARRRDSLGTR